MSEKTTKIIELKRNCLDNGTFGKITLDGEFLCYTVERPWLSNLPFKSCVPPGEYDLHPYDSPKHPNCFYLENKNLGVSLSGTTRTHILIHVANWVEEVEGCIGPGMSLHPARWGVGRSKSAMNKLRSLIDCDKFDWKLRIIQ